MTIVGTPESKALMEQIHRLETGLSRERLQLLERIRKTRAALGPAAANAGDVLREWDEKDCWDNGD